MSRESIQADEIQVLAYPNPSSHYFNIEVKSDNKSDHIQIYVYDMTLKLLFSNKFLPSQLYTFGEKLESGIYTVKITQGDQIKTFNVIKK